MNLSEKHNQNLMYIIKKMHGIIEETDIEKARASQEHVSLLAPSPKTLEIENVNIDEMSCEWIRPARPHSKRRVILYCHGGGYMTGSYTYSRSITCKLSEATSMDLFCFNYRLSPENPYPAAVEDAIKAWNYLMLLGYGAKDIILCGDSAGGNLALELTINLNENGRILPGAIVLYSPWTDLTCSGKSYKTKEQLDPVLTKEYIDTAISGYAGNNPPDDYHISPLFADFHGFPPIYIQVGTNEILYSDSAMLYKKLLNAGVRVSYDTFKGMWHVFQMTPFKAASDAIEKTSEFIFEVFR